MNPDTLLNEQMQQYLDGPLTPENAANLACALTTDPAAADRFAELTRLDSGLQEALREDARAVLFQRRLESAEVPPEAVSPSAGNWRRHGAIAAALAVAGGAGLALWHWVPAGTPELTDSSPPERRHRVAPVPGPWSPATHHLTTQEKPGDPGEMRRRLRSFFVPDAGVKSLPLTEALLALSRQWETLPHEKGTKVPELTVAESVKQHWKATGREPVVSLGVPGISLLTHLNLAAAQAGLRVNISKEGAILEPDPRSVPDGEKTWTFALGRNAVQRVRQLSQRVTVSVHLLKSDHSYDWLLPGTPSPDSLTKFYQQPVPPVTAEISPSDTFGTSLTLNASPEVLSLSGIFKDGVSGAFTVDEGGLVEGPDLIIDHPVLPVPEQVLSSLLAAHGSSAVGAVWDEADQMLSLTGQVSELRAAEALIQAVKESAGSGVRLEMRLVSFTGAFPDSRTDEELMEHSRGILLSKPHVTAALGQSTSIFIAGFNEAHDLSMTSRASRSGDQISLDFKISQCRQTVAMEGEVLPPDHRGETVKEMNSRVTVGPGEWRRIPGFVDQNFKGQRVEMLQFVRAIPVTMDPPPAEDRAGSARRETGTPSASR